MPAHSRCFVDRCRVDGRGVAWVQSLTPSANCRPWKGWNCLFWVHSARRPAGVWVRGRSVASRPFRSPVLIGPASSQRGSPGSGWGSPPAPGLPLPLPTPPTGAHRVTRPARPHLVWFKVRLPGGGGGREGEGQQARLFFLASGPSPSRQLSRKRLVPWPCSSL